MLLKLLDDVITPGPGIDDAIFLTEPQGDTAAGAAVAYLLFENLSEMTFCAFVFRYSFWLSEYNSVAYLLTGETRTLRRFLGQQRIGKATHVWLVVKKVNT